MHEASLAQNVINIVGSYTDEINGRSVKSITLRIGELMGIYPESLQFYFNELSKGTIAEHSDLIIEESVIKGKCRKCNNEFEIVNFEFNCPECNNSQFDIIGGNEFELVKLEVE